MKDVKKFIKAKRRKKIIKKVTILTIVLVIALAAFFTKAPIFNLQKVTFIGNATIADTVLLSQLSDKIGENIFLLNQKEMKERLLENKYIKEVKIKTNSINSLKIEILEEAPVYYINNNERYLIINENLSILEEVDSLEGRNLVEIKGIDLSGVSDESREEEYNSYKSILANFYPYISKNREAIRLRELNIVSIVDIKGYIGNIEILFGDDSDLHNKMEKIYNIILSEEIQMTKGYINVGFNGDPVIMVEESGEEDDENSQGDDGVDYLDNNEAGE